MTEMVDSRLRGNDKDGALLWISRRFGTFAGDMYLRITKEKGQGTKD